MDSQMPDSDEFTVDEMDKFINTKVQISHNDTMQHAVVNSRKIYAFGNPVGKYHSNHLLDMRRYEVKFQDVTVK